MFEAFFVALSSVWADSGFSALTGGHVIMICVGLLLLYMAIAKGFEPLLLSWCYVRYHVWYSPRSIPAVDLLGRRRYDRLWSSAG